MVLQRYRAKAELGKGSFGTVYLTEGRRDRKTYVVKVVDNLRENNLKVQEIRVMMHLKHRNIVEMCDFYTSNNQLCIVMDYADGGDLRREIVKARGSKVPISEEMITLWMIQVCQALEYAHEEQIIHRDIKPSNIFLMSDGRSVKVGDFGISKVLDTAVGRDQMAAPEPEGRVGTKRYMAPEVLNRQEYSNKADIWSLGCVLFELTTLNHPTYEQERRVYFEWIPAVYTRNMQELIRACMSEQASLRPSPRELLVKLAAPMMHHASVQQEFLNAMSWFDQQLANKYKQYEAQAAIIRQFIPTHVIKQPQHFSPPEAPSANKQAPTPPQPAISAPQAAPPQAAAPTPAAADVPRQPPPGGWADPSTENFSGTGIVLSMDHQGVISVSGLLKGSTAEQSRMVDVGDVVQEVDSHNVFRKYAALPMDILSGQMGSTVRVGLQKTPDPRRLTYIVLRRAHTPGAPQAPQSATDKQHRSSQNGQAPIQQQQAMVAPSQEHDRSVITPPPGRISPSHKSTLTLPQAVKADNDLEHFNIPEYTDDGDMSPKASASSSAQHTQLNTSLQQAHEASQQLHRQRQLAQQQLQQQQQQQQQRMQEQQQQQLEQRLMLDSQHHNMYTSASPAKPPPPAAPALHQAYNVSAQQYGASHQRTGSAPPMKPNGFQYVDNIAAAAAVQQQQQQQQQHFSQFQPHPNMNLSASFEARSSSHLKLDPQGRSLSSSRQEPASPHHINTRSSYGEVYQQNQFGYEQNFMMQQQSRPSISSMRSSHDGRALAPDMGGHGGYPSLRSSFDSASLRDSASFRASTPTHSSLAPSLAQTVTTPQLSNADGDTNRVLAELERVRTGIQATLAAAAASGKLPASGSGSQLPAGGMAASSAATRHPPAPVAAPPAPSGSHMLGSHNGLSSSSSLRTQSANSKTQEVAASDQNRYAFAEL